MDKCRASWLAVRYTNVSDACSNRVHLQGGRQTVGVLLGICPYENCQRLPQPDMKRILQLVDTLRPKQAPVPH